MKKNDFAPITVRIAVAVQMTGIGRSKIYELIASGDIEIVKIGSSTLILMDTACAADQEQAVSNAAAHG